MGFITSLDLKRFQEKHRMNATMDNMLTLISTVEDIPTLKFMDLCEAADIASKNTAHKYLQRLKENAFVDERMLKDGRIKLVSIADRGRTYLQRWSTGDR